MHTVCHTILKISKINSHVVEMDDVIWKIRLEASTRIIALKQYLKF